MKPAVLLCCASSKRPLDAAAGHFIVCFIEPEGGAVAVCFWVFIEGNIDGAAATVADNAAPRVLIALSGREQHRCAEAEHVPGQLFSHGCGGRG